MGGRDFLLPSGAKTCLKGEREAFGLSRFVRGWPVIADPLPAAYRYRRPMVARSQVDLLRGTRQERPRYIVTRSREAEGASGCWARAVGPGFPGGMASTPWGPGARGGILLGALF